MAESKDNLRSRVVTAINEGNRENLKRLITIAKSLKAEDELEMLKKAISSHNAFTHILYKGKSFPTIKSLAEATKRIDGNFIQFSTDYVFNGTKKNPYLPDDIKSPLNIYGETKSFGEDFVKDIFKNSSKGIIIRTSWLMSSIGNNFAVKILNLLAKNKKINIIEDQVAAPTSTKILSKACWQAIKLISEGEKLPTILHVTNSGQASWYDISIEIYTIAKDIGLLESTVEINPIKTFEYNSKVIRPHYSVLNCQESFESLLINNYDWKKAINDLVIDYQRGI